MFTGIIKAVGRVASKSRSVLRVKVNWEHLDLGESIAVNGACLTVAAGSKKRLLHFDVSDETWSRTNLGNLKIGESVNLEPALKAGEALGGHLVTGHVDAQAKILVLERLPGGFAKLRVALPMNLRGLVAVKGSIAIDGISLTVTALSRAYVETVLVPHTIANTNFCSRKKGQIVNLEADLIARYVQSALKG